MCYDSNSKSIDDIAVWSRTTTLSDDLLTTIDGFLSKLNVTLKNFKKIDHSTEA